MSQNRLPSSQTWPWPLHLETYDRSPFLTKEEQTELARLAAWRVQLQAPSKAKLVRLLRPLYDAFGYFQTHVKYRQLTIRLLNLEMSRRGKAFWGWSLEEWCESICLSHETFARRYGFPPDRYYPHRSHLAALAYVLCPHLIGDQLLSLIEIRPLADKIFGKEAVTRASEQVITTLKSWGYQEKDHSKLITCICYLLLLNQNPQIEHLTIGILEATAKSCASFVVPKYTFQVSRVLAGLGIIASPLPGRAPQQDSSSGTDGSMAPEWLAWCQRWKAQSTIQNKQNVYYSLLKVGRWLHARHPEIVSPAQWTYDLAAEFVAAVMEMKVGQWADSSVSTRNRPKHLGQPLRPAGRYQILASMRAMLRDCQEWHWIPVTFNATRALRTPSSLYRLIGPAPRVIDKMLWAKLIWAVMNLEEKDLPTIGHAHETPKYPFQMVRAVAAVWCFAALRSDEIVRLRTGCIRWQYEDVMIPETGEILPKDAICFLDVPVNKTSTAYTKPLHPFAGHQINEWERVRPKEQPESIDHKTGESVQYLFSYRGSRISKQYITDYLIPILCRKGGIPLEDSRGKITSHRARATIASQLYNAKDPLSIFELKEYLGHKQLSSTQRYVAVDPTKLAKQVSKAGYLEQNLSTIEVLLDQEAVRSGAAARGEPWKYYDLGHGYCLNDFWAECKHRMACARCPFYCPKESMADQLLEGQANLLHMLEFVQLTEEEKLLVTEGIDLHQALIEQLADVPTPAGLTPREMDVQEVRETTVIPLKAVKRNLRKTQDK